MKFPTGELSWINQPNLFTIETDAITITTEPGTDFWQRTYYGFRNDNAHALVLPLPVDFSLSVKTHFDTKKMFDQCGVVIYQDCDNWFKASIEYENDEYQRLGSVVTNHGYSDWATTDIPADIKEMHYRLSRRGADFCIEHSLDGSHFKQMRIFHLFSAEGSIAVGFYACSPLDSSFTAVFSAIKLGECLWPAHHAAT